MDSFAPQAARLMILGRVVAAVATPARGPSVPGVAVRSGVIMWASSPFAATAAVAAWAASAPALTAGGSTRTCTSAVPASSHCPSL